MTHVSVFRYLVLGGLLFLTLPTIHASHNNNQDVKYSESSFHGDRRTIGQDDSPIVAHLIPQSHCDVAYKKTFDEYYETEVRTVLNAVTASLHESEDRRFVWSETSFLAQWWQDPRTTTQQKQVFQDLVAQERLEIVNGGWVMHDEAITRYDSQIHQMTVGHEILQQIFVDEENRPNISVTTGWQIDPFVPSPFTVNLCVWAGMDFLILNRLDAEAKSKLQAEQSLQFHWETPQGASIIVNVLDTHYESPKTFDWEHVDGIPVTDDNVEERSDTFVQILRDRASYYLTPQIMVPLGGDFDFQNASLQFENIERIMDYVHANPERYQNATIQFSTPREYREALVEALALTKQELPTITNSRIGKLGSPPVTGYFFQDPNLKQMLRTCEILLGITEVRLFQSLRRGDSWDFLVPLVRRISQVRKSVALMQHHDAITATSYRFVLAFYIQLLVSAFQDLEDVLSQLAHGDQSSESPLERNRSSRAEEGSIIGGGAYLHETVLVRGSEDNKAVHIEKVLKPEMGGPPKELQLFNSLSTMVTTVVHFVCTRPDVAILRVNLDGSTSNVPSQATPLEHELSVGNLGLFLISFEASISPVGMGEYEVLVCDLTWTTEQHPEPVIPSLRCADIAAEINEEDLVTDGLSSDVMQVDFDSETLDLLAMSRILGDGHKCEANITHDLVLYDGSDDNVYKFATNVESSDPPPLFGHRRRRFVSAYRGPLFSQVTLEFTPWLAVRYRVMNTIGTHHEDGLLQVTMFSGPLPPSVDLASRFSTSLVGTGWLIEENGFLPVSAKYNASRGVGDGNTRPVVSRTWIEQLDTGLRLSAFSVDPRGAVSKKEGELEIFWHRRNNYTHSSYNKTTPQWWKSGEDKSTARSSVWLELSHSHYKHADSQSKEIARELSQDLAVFSVELKGNQTASYPATKLTPRKLHVVSLRLSKADLNFGQSQDSVWVDLQIENLDEYKDEEMDLALFLKDSPRLVLDAMEMHSLTYLYSIDGRSEHKPLRRPSEEEKIDLCALEPFEGGKQWILKIGPRHICSVRIPVSPIAPHEAESTSKPKHKSTTNMLKDNKKKNMRGSTTKKFHPT